jgi:branched-chain amino acid transport system substrate-binding protein
MVPFVQGIQLWVKAVNARGGLNGHPVKFLVLDDDSDPSRHRALVQEAVEVRHALAFLGNAAPLSGGAGVAYVTEKKVPVILVCGCEPWAYQSPMMFPATANGDTALRVILESGATRSVPAGKKRLGVLTCAEAQVCRDADRVWADHARDFGFAQVYRGQYSITQPDFTAECLAMRNAGAEFTQITATPAILRNIVTSCTRQGFRPTYGMTLSMVEEGQKGDADLAGAMASSVVFPYFQTGTPATDAFAAALRDYGRGLTPGVGLTQGWTGGKLLERATAALPEPPTTTAVLDGLWSIKGDDLGGLTGPLTFTANQPATPVACWFNLELRGRWTSPDDFSRHCE